MTDVLGWAVVAWILCIPVLFVLITAGARRRNGAEDAGGPSSGGLLGMDELFHPSAHDARVQWEAELEIPAPAPTPDRGPGAIEDDERIVIDLGEDERPR